MEETDQARPLLIARAMAVGTLPPALETGEAFAGRIRRDREILGAIVRRTGAGVN